MHTAAHNLDVESEAAAPKTSGFGALLRQHRIAAGLSQEALAERARMSTEGIGALERGSRRTPQRETVALLLGALGLSAEQRRVFEDAADQSRRRGPRTVVAAGPNTGAMILPMALSRFVGRESELADIAALLREHRLVTLTGAGGVGKTQTALRAAIAAGDSTRALCFVALAALDDAALVVQTIATSLCLEERPGHSLLDTVLSYIENKELLLVVDNCEHVIAEVARVVEAILGACPNVRILATSREPLKAASERAYRLPSLDVSVAVELFAERASAVDQRFSLTEQNASIAADVCRRLDGIPLAIELAAARASVLSLAGIAAKLDDRFRLLAGGERTALPRRQTMRAAIEWSYNLLAPQEQRVFERLSIFSGGCTLGAAERVCADEESAATDVMELLASLVDKSLVLVDFEGRETRYGLLESFREFARERLAARGETALVARRHALAALDLARQMYDASRSQPERVLIELANAETDNWRSALRWALVERGDVELGQRMVGELIPLWQWFETSEGKRWIEAAVEAVDASTPTSVLARLDHARAAVSLAPWELDVALASSRSAAQRYRSVGDDAGLVRALAFEGIARCHAGHAQEAKVPLEEALAKARELPFPRDAAFALTGLATADEALGDADAAREHLLEAKHLLEISGSVQGVASVLVRLSDIELVAGNLEAALQYSRDAQPMLRASLDTPRGARGRNYAAYLLHLAQCLAMSTRYDEAEERLNEALALAPKFQDDTFAASALALLGIVRALRVLDDFVKNVALFPQAARALGFANAHFSAIHWMPRILQLPRYASAVETLRKILGANAFAAQMEIGAAMPEAQARAEISALRLEEARH